jgi:Fanconi anemia group M protein
LKDHARIVGLTATIPSERAKAKEIIDNLFIDKIEQRDEDSQDVKQYIQKTEIETIEVELPLIIKKIREYLKNAIDNRIATLKRSGLVNGGSITELIRIKEYDIIKKNRNLANLLYSTIRLYHALKILDTQSINAFVKFCERLKERKGIGAYSLLADPNFKDAYEIARGAMISNIEHPKISKLYQILSKEEGKILIFTSYRDNVKVLYDRLKMQGYRVGYLIGKAGEEGLKEDEQVYMVQKFRDGTINILIATNVGEEGLDISECNLVIFYDNVPSVIRFIQRKGRTGRKSAGRVILLVTKDTLDEAYSYISRRKIKTAKNIAKRIKPKKKDILDYL